MPKTIIDKFSLDDYISIMEETDHIYIDVNRGYHLLNYYNAMKNAATEYFDFITTINGHTGTGRTPQSFKNFLIDDLDINKELLKYQGKYSVDRDKVLEPLLRSGYLNPVQKEIIEAYCRLKEIEGNLNTFRSKFESVKEIENGIGKMYFYTSGSDTGRIYYNDQAILSIPHEFLEVQVAKPGYVLIFGDCKQADLRGAYNMYLKTPETLPFFEHSDEYYRSTLQTTDKEHYDEDKFQKLRPAMKELVLASIYGSRRRGLLRTYNSPEAVDLLMKFLASNEKYQAIKKSLETAIATLPVLLIEDYFGFKRKIICDKGALNAALNTPVQATTNSIVSIMVTEANKAGIDVYMVRHDEPVFMVKEEDLPKAMEFLKNRQKLYINDWTLFEVRYSYGHIYGEEEGKIPTSEEDWIIEVKNRENWSLEVKAFETEMIVSEIDNGFIGAFTYDKTKVVRTEVCNSEEEVLKQLYKSLEEYSAGYNYIVMPKIIGKSILGDETNGKLIVANNLFLHFSALDRLLKEPNGVSYLEVTKIIGGSN